MPQLDPTWFASQLFWLAITFVMLYFVLSRFVLPPLQEVMARRNQTVEGDVAQAQNLKSQAEAAKQDYEKALAEARARAQQLMNDAAAEIKSTQEQKARELERTITAKLRDADDLIRTKKAEMMAALTPATTELTTMIVEKLTRKAPSKDQVNLALQTLGKGER